MSEASMAMQIAGELRSEGWDASSALEEGWRQVIGESSNPVDKAGGSLLLLVALGYGIWTLTRKSWTPWQQTVSRRLALPKPRAPVVDKMNLYIDTVVTSGAAGTASTVYTPPRQRDDHNRGIEPMAIIMP